VPLEASATVRQAGPAADIFKLPQDEQNYSCAPERETTLDQARARIVAGLSLMQMGLLLMRRLRESSARFDVLMV